jgi:probable 2-oxoglutarate dehydrogenase E1 component DHKTD1
MLLLGCLTGNNKNKIRGRLNILSSLLNMPSREIFNKINGKSEFSEDFKGTGDVLSHLGTSTMLKYFNDKDALNVSLINNPSHLEAGKKTK